MKLNSSSDVEWQKTYGGANYDGVSSVQQTNDGGFIVAANTKSFGAANFDYDLWVLKIDKNGKIVPNPGNDMHTFNTNSNVSNTSVPANSTSFLVTTTSCAVNTSSVVGQNINYSVQTQADPNHNPYLEITSVSFDPHYSTMVVNWTASDIDDDNITISIDLRNESGVLKNFSGIENNGSYTMNVADLMIKGGTYIVRVNASDDFGGRTAAEYTIKLETGIDFVTLIILILAVGTTAAVLLIVTIRRRKRKR